MAGRKRIHTNVIIIYLIVTVARAEEPHCSKYDFEEKLLEKIVRMEFEMERMKSEVRNSLDLMKNLNSHVERSRKSLDENLADLNVTKNRMIKELESEVLAAKDKTKSPTVVFKARSNDQIDIQSGGILVYPTVIVNEGSGYDTSSGIFTAPVNGTYSFSITFCVRSARSIAAAIMIDGTRYSASVFGDSRWSMCYSTDAVAVVKSGQKVCVQVLDGGHTGTDVIVHSDANYWNTFSGALLIA